MARIKWRDKEIDSLISPNTSVTKEFVRTEDGTVLGQKHTINVKGYILASGDPLSQGTDSRQNYLYGKIANFLNLGSTGTLNNIPINQAGKLEIQPVGEGGNTITYDNAQLINLNLPETPEDTAGIQYQEYAFTFESYQPLYTSGSGDIYSAYRLKSVSENWELQKQQDQLSFVDNNFTLDDSLYAYTLSHTVSAVGLQNFDNGAYKNSAWYEAYKYVNSRLVETPVSSYISKDAYTSTLPASSTFAIDQWKGSGVASGNIIASPTGYLAYNKIRTSTVDVPGGSYSVTSTYLMSRSSGTFDINTQYSEDESGEVTITVEGTVTPLSSQDINSLVNDKYRIASGIYQQISDSGNWTKATALASGALSTYKGSGCTGNLVIDRYPRAITVGRNKINGAISFNLTYKGISSGIRSLKDSISGAIAATVSVIDDNRSNSYNLGYKTIAVIPILGRAGGPIIQDMGTTKERKRTIAFDVTMKQACRSQSGAPTGYIYPLVSGYQPVGVGSSYVQNFQETWDWTNGRYNLTVDWIYT